MQALTGLWASQFGTLNWAAHDGFCSVNNAILSISDIAVPVPLQVLSLCLLAAGLIAKYRWFCLIGKPSGTTIQSATTFAQSNIQLLDPGHTSATFINKEFVYHVGPKTTTLARRTTLILSFLLPPMAIIFSMLTLGNSSTLLFIAAISVYIGLFLERWLFFVEAKHVVRHYEAP